MDKLYVHDTETHNKVAPAIILPYLFDLIRVSSVLDIGCGLGTWVSVCEDLGVHDVMGIDGDYVDLSLLTIAREKFVPADLTKPISVNRKFDLAICLEVGEHLPLEAADTFVDTITRHSDNVLFSAAIPGQGGQNHINEQPYEFWEEKFKRRGYVYADLIRPVFWNDDRIEWWYRQNMFLVTKDTSLAPKTAKIGTAHHPQRYGQILREKESAERQMRELKYKFISGDISVLDSTKIFLKSVRNKFTHK